jgi:Tfp pilus assembly protein PilO
MPKILIFILINFLALIFLGLLLNSLKGKTLEMKKMKNLAAETSRVNLENLETEIAETQDKSEQLATVFPNEEGLIGFIQKIDELKKDKYLTYFSFAADNILKDKTGYSGLPLVLEAKGSWQQIGETLSKIYSLPFIVRPINVEIRQVAGNEMNLKLGGILYVSKNFNQN